MTRQNYSWSIARQDLLAGLTVAAISLPQAMAYALIAGIDPKFGLYSAIVVTAVASIFGSSSHLINGPTNAISLVVFSALAFIDPQNHNDVYQATFLLGLMIGVIQIAIAVFKLGDLTRYISESVVVGFMAGAGALVALSQVGNFFGLHDQGTGHQHVLLRFWLTLTQGGPINWPAFSIGFGTLILVIGLRKVVRRYRLPQMDMLLALIVASVVAAQLGWSIPDANGKTLLSVIGKVPASLPTPQMPLLNWDWVRQLSGSAVAISFLGLLEALAIAKSISHSTRQHLDYNRQCLAEGLANFAGGFFQCLPGSGSLTRSAINFQSGAKTRASGLFAAAAVAIVLLLFAPWARFIPKTALAAMLMVTAARLIDWKRLRYAMRASHYDAGLVVITGFSAIFISVEFSILIGVGLSMLMFVPRVAHLQFTELVVSKGVVREHVATDPPCTALIIKDIEGELFFGVARELDRFFDNLRIRLKKEHIRHAVLRVKHCHNPDMVALERFEHFLRDMQEENIVVLLCGVRPAFAKGMHNLGFQEWFPQEHIFLEEPKIYTATLKAVSHAYELLGDHHCSHCGTKEHFINESKGHAQGHGHLHYLI